MGNYFLDTSTLVKRYHLEAGSDEVNALFQREDARVYISDLSKASILLRHDEVMLGSTTKTNISSRTSKQRSIIHTSPRDGLVRTIHCPPHPPER